MMTYVALHSEAGGVIPETGGLRKLRWVAKGKGKRGGSRVIYYFHNQELPLFLMAIYTKSIQADLPALRKRFLVKQLRTLKSELRELGPK
jgi:hypothetical protein